MQLFSQVQVHITMHISFSCYLCGGRIYYVQLCIY